MSTAPDPYRDDRPSLLAENERLRRELMRHRQGVRVWPVAAALAAHVALRPLFDPWLNGTSDGKWWGAVAVLAVPLVLAAVALVRALRTQNP